LLVILLKLLSGREVGHILAFIVLSKNLEAWNVLGYNMDSLLYGYGTTIVCLMLLHHVQVVNLMLFEAGLCVPIFAAYTICRLSCIACVWDTLLVFCYHLSCVCHAVMLTRMYEGKSENKVPYFIATR
jgi:hypothetical protein